MKKLIKKYIDSFLGKFQYILLKKGEYLALLDKSKFAIMPGLLEKFVNSNNMNQILLNITNSKAQLFQDIVCLEINNFKTNGYFVEFGATNGLMGSNTHLLEKSFNWNGILCEPGINWHKELYLNRNCHIDKSCVYFNSNSTITFFESVHPELSTIEDFKNSDQHSKSRFLMKKYNVNTITLEDLLIKYNAPQNIDYLSVDTEGSEFDILNAFDFSKYKFNFISVEHNFQKNKRDQIYNLLVKNNYKRIYSDISECDDWYTPEF
ncbi:MAG: FkbM family methyltransferase [Candidatus Kapaibacteriota bacterium]